MTRPTTADRSARPGVRATRPARAAARPAVCARPGRRPAPGAVAQHSVARTTHRSYGVAARPVRSPRPVAGQVVRQQPKMRLTRRGRLLVTLLLTGLVLVAFSIGRASTQAGDAPAGAPRPTVVVQSGDTLWQIAREAAPDADPRVTVARILELNDLDSASSVRAGQQLTLP